MKLETVNSEIDHMVQQAPKFVHRMWIKFEKLMKFGYNLQYVSKNVITYLKTTAKIVPFVKFFKF